MTILGIETSCDETAAAIAHGDGEKLEIISNVVASQIEIHEKYGGVVPEVAARQHVLSMLPIINETLEKAVIKRAEAKDKIDAIAVATGPGLITSLLIGTETAKTLGYAWNVPTISINHVEAHIYANFISDSRSTIHSFEYPAVILTVSGGHTMLVLMEGHGKLKNLGQTRDDAAGEAFDKAASLMDLGYPGGPKISTEAAKVKKTDIELPRPMIDAPNYEFSFSGLKTALRYQLEKDKNWRKRIPDYAHEFQQAVIDVLIKKSIRAAKECNAKTVMLTGGVAANLELREQMKGAVEKEFPQAKFTIPELKYTTDNAAMVASAGYFKAKQKKFTPWSELKVDCNLEI